MWHPTRLEWLLGFAMAVSLVGCGGGSEGTAETGAAGSSSPASSAPGSPSAWPDKKIILYTPDNDSGTYEFFSEVILGSGKAKQRKDVQASPDDNTLVTGVAGDEFSLGYFGYAYYAANKDKLRALAIQNGPDAKAVAPSPATILDLSYQPLSRPLYIYVKNTALARPEVADFVRYYVENVESLTTRAGYVPPHQDDQEANLKALPKAPGDAKLGGSIVVSGSSTVYRISRAAQIEYKKKRQGVNVLVKNVGTGGGFGSYLEGEVDIVDASRKAKPEEEEKAKAKGLEWTRFTVGYDGITLVVNPRNSFVQSLSVEQLKALLAEDSTVKTWKDLAAVAGSK